MFVPWLAYSGTEIGNGSRVAAYLNRFGLARGRVQVGTDGTECDCPAITGTYGAPASDSAPWYEPTYAWSADFLGFWPSSIEVPPTVRRAVTPLAHRGSAVGGLRREGRVVLVEGYVFARSPLGMQWGERWLSEALGAGCCECELGDLCVLPACPPATETVPGADAYFRTLSDAGLADGPVFTPVVSSRGSVQRVAFSMASRHPYLFQDAVERCTVVFNGAGGS